MTWRALGLLLSALLAGFSAGCSVQLDPKEEPEPVVVEPPPLLEVSSPLDGLEYADADDADPHHPGLQLPVRVQLRDLENGLALEDLTLLLPSGQRRTAAVTETRQGRFAVWPAITVLDEPGSRPRKLTIEAYTGEKTETASVRFQARYQGASAEGCELHLAWEGDLDIEQPQDLPGGDACLTVTGSLRVQATGLDTLADLQGLLEVGGDLEIVANPELIDLDELRTLRRVGGNLTITDNPALPTEDAERLLGRIGPHNVGGEVLIADNG